MAILPKVLMCFVTMVTVTYGCSEPEGGWVDPTEAETVHYSSHVVVGTVLEIITPDPVYGDMYKPDMVYGAQVQVLCMYKGGPLKSEITIHGAGFVPGLCLPKDLEVGKEYILFLSEQRDQDVTYEQAQPAKEYKHAIDKYLTVCDVTVTYPKDGSRARDGGCPAAKATVPCSRYNVKKGMTVTEIPEVTSRQPKMKLLLEGIPKATPAGTQGPKTGYSRNTAPRLPISVAGATLCAILSVFMAH